jgi:MFS transporter, PHS family, inorganic phosphate transporter
MSTDGIELMIIIVATFGQAISGSGAAVNIFGVLIVWRFLVRQFLYRES